MHVYGMLLVNRGSLAEAIPVLRDAAVARLRAGFQWNQDDYLRDIIRNLGATLASQAREPGHPVLLYDLPLLPDRDDRLRAEVAHLRARAALHFRKQFPDPTPGDDRVLQHLCDFAVDNLRELVKGGYRGADDLRTSPDFELLRERDDFKQLLRELSKP
jgi:hypothetical protein